MGRWGDCCPFDAIFDRWAKNSKEFEVVARLASSFNAVMRALPPAVLPRFVRKGRRRHWGDKIATDVAQPPHTKIERRWRRDFGAIVI